MSQKTAARSSSMEGVSGAGAVGLHDEKGQQRVWRLAAWFWVLLPTARHPKFKATLDTHTFKPWAAV